MNNAGNDDENPCLFSVADYLGVCRDEDLQFKVHLKENQQLKHLNSGSEHPQACCVAIPNGVNQRLAKLTTRTSENDAITIDKLHGEHAKAFEQAGFRQILDAR